MRNYTACCTQRLGNYASKPHEKIEENALGNLFRSRHKFTSDERRTPTRITNITWPLWRCLTRAVRSYTRLQMVLIWRAHVYSATGELSVYMYICIYVYMYICIYVYMYTNYKQYTYTGSENIYFPTAKKDLIMAIVYHRVSVTWLHTLQIVCTRSSYMHASPHTALGLLVQN